jgi:hypothetical protein
LEHSAVTIRIINEGFRGIYKLNPQGVINFEVTDYLFSWLVLGWKGSSDASLFYYKNFYIIFKSFNFIKILVGKKN